MTLTTTFQDGIIAKVCMKNWWGNVINSL